MFWVLEDGGALRIFLNSEDLQEAPDPAEYPNMEVNPAVGTLVPLHASCFACLDYSASVHDWNLKDIKRF